MALAIEAAKNALVIWQVSRLFKSLNPVLRGTEQLRRSHEF
jgi:hypothetical protein